MWMTNQIEGDLGGTAKRIKIKRNKSDGRLLVENKEGGYIYLAPASSKEIIKEKYLPLVLSILGIALVEVIAYRSMIFVITAVILEFMLRKKSQRICFSHAKKLFGYLKGFIAIEFVVYIALMFWRVENVMISAPLASSLFLLNFYLFFRVYLFILELKFHKIYRMEGHDGFFVWSHKC